MSAKSKRRQAKTPFEGSRSSTSFGSNPRSSSKGAYIDVNQLPPRAKSTNSKPSKSRTRSLKNRQTPDSVNPPSRYGSASSRNGNRIGKQCNTVEDIVRLIATGQAKNVVVMVGAGISTSSGIPDFRSPGTGLYDNLRQYRIPQPQAIFDHDYFEGNPRPFLTLAKELYPGRYRPNTIHYFLRLLHEKGLLLRVYTQNIDGLERMSGIPAQKLVEAHGSFLTASCIRCHQVHPTDTIKATIMADGIPRCKRNGCLGLVKPDIVFFGEDLPKRFYYYLKDFPQADLLIVMGTSLEVEPFAEIVDSVRHIVPRILFNRVAVGPFRMKRRMNDVCALGDLTSSVAYFAKMLGWSSELNKLMEDHQASLSEKFGHSPQPPKATTSSNTTSTTNSAPASNISSIDRDLSKLSLHSCATKPAATKTTFPDVQVSKGHKSAPHGQKTRLLDGRPPIPVHRNPPRVRGLAWTKPVSSFHSQKHLYRKRNDSSSEEEMFGKDSSSDEDTSSDDDDDE